MDFKFRIILAMCLFADAYQGGRVRYDNYGLYEAIASNGVQLKVLKHLETSGDPILFLDGVHKLNNPIKIVVAPRKARDFLELMQMNEIEFELIESNLQRKLDNDQETVGKFNPLARPASSYNWNQYYELEDTYSWLRKLAIENPGVVTLIKAGKSYQRRSILAVKISKSRSEKPGVFIEAGIHAREWIGPAVATYMIHQLLNSDVPEVKQIAENYNWYILPHANPDGYVYTHTTDRMWRKTRTPYGPCYGADANRNWDSQWRLAGSSNSSCDQTYSGPTPFSEIETRSLAQYLRSLKGKISLYISLHSYSQVLLFPYGYTADLPANYKDLQQVFSVSIAALAKRYGTEYNGGNVYDAIYPASGSSIDWAYDNIETKMSFCYELRPNSLRSDIAFSLPTSEIIPTGTETLDSIVAMVNEVQRLGYFK